MTKFNEDKLDEILVDDNTNRKIIVNSENSPWGQLILPGKDENPDKTNKGLKVLIMASYRTGFLLLNTLIEFEKRFPDKLNIVGLITDDPVSQDAKISLKRRIWRFFNDEEKLEIEEAIVEEALCFGIPCYTGAVKTEYARNLLKKWNPDVIQVFVFGQIIDTPIITFPKMGIYNYHPADLAHHHGAGPQPYQDLINRDAHTSLFTIHQLSEELDSGHILGQSPEINIRMEDGTLSHNLLVIEDKMIEPMDFMAVVLTNSLIANWEKGIITPIIDLDFASYFNKIQKNELMRPIVSHVPSDIINNISKFTLNLLDK